MKENKKDETNSTTTKIQPDQNNQESTQKDKYKPNESIETDEDASKQTVGKYIKEGHGHDYSTPVAGEDGGTEDQSKSEKQNKGTDKRQPTEQGKTEGESASI